jgi:hypothetical protein
MTELIVLIIVGIGALGFNVYSCNSKASMMGRKSSWGPVQGCMVQTKDGNYMPLNSVRTID